MDHLEARDLADAHAGISDLQAIDEVNRGNREMFEVLVRRYNRQLFRVGISYLRRREPAEDAMQNAYLKAFVHLGNFQRTASFPTWITRIMINECLMILRRRREASAEDIATAEEFPETSAPLGAAWLNLKDMKTVLEDAIAALPRNLRTVFVLREVQQLSTEEAAACLRVTSGSIKVTLHRARERLKAALLQSAAGAELFEYRAEFCDPLTTRVMAAILAGR